MRRLFAGNLIEYFYYEFLKVRLASHTLSLTQQRLTPELFYSVLNREEPGEIESLTLLPFKFIICNNKEDPDVIWCPGKTLFEH